MIHRPDLPATSKSRSRSRWQVNPYGFYGLVFGVLTIVLFVALVLLPLLPLIACWLIATSLTAFLAFAYDKSISNRRWARVPENVLLGIALIGGSPGALVAMRLVHHKTAKKSFLARMAVVLALQIAVIAVYLLVIR